MSSKQSNVDTNNAGGSNSGGSTNDQNTGSSANNGNAGNSNANNRNGNGGSSGNQNNRRNDNGRRNIFSANERSWSGDKADIGAVLGLRVEQLDNKHSYRSFLEKMTEYVLRELNNPHDILELLTEQKDPRPSLKANILVKVEDEDKDNDVMVAIQQQRIKLYVTREMELETNMLKVYGLTLHKTLSQIQKGRGQMRHRAFRRLIWILAVWIQSCNVLS